MAHFSARALHKAPTIHPSHRQSYEGLDQATRDRVLAGWEAGALAKIPQSLRDRWDALYVEADSSEAACRRLLGRIERDVQSLGGGASVHAVVYHSADGLWRSLPNGSHYGMGGLVAVEQDEVQFITVETEQDMNLNGGVPWKAILRLRFEAKPLGV